MALRRERQLAICRGCEERDAEGRCSLCTYPASGKMWSAGDRRASGRGHQGPREEGGGNGSPLVGERFRHSAPQDRPTADNVKQARK
jgi:hypothetical protein